MSTTELSLGPDAIRQITTGEVAMQVIDHKQVESLLAAERRTLEMIACGASLTDVLEDLCDTIDDQAPEIISSILLMDPNGEQLWPAAGRRVPEGWVRTITPLPIGPGMGSCGTAAFLKKPVIISDIASDPPWSDITAPDYTEIALSYGLRAAWSQPLISKDNELLGTFAIYYREPRQPSDTDLKLIEGAANIAVIAIKGERSQTALKNAFEEIRQSEGRLRKIIDTIPTLAWCGLPDASKEFFNKRWHDYTGLSPEEASGWGWKVTIHPDDLEKLMDRSFKFIASEEPGEVEARMRRFDGEYRWFLFRAEPLRDDSGDIIRWYGTNIDIGERKRAEALLAAEKRTLEMIASGALLVDILENLCNTIDAQVPNLISTVMLMDTDGMRLWPGAGPWLPKGWIDAIAPVTIGHCVRSCGTAVFRRQRVIASDIATDPTWADYRDVALSYWLRAAWSQPLLSKNQQVLGTFGMYYTEPRTPGETDLRLIEGAGHVAVIAIEGERARTALEKASEEIKKSEAELRTIIDAIPQLIVALGADGNFLYANQAVSEFTGLTKEEVASERFREIFHPEDTERLRDERDAAIARGAAFEYERRIRRKDGQYRWFLAQYKPLLGERGEVTHWYVTGTDIDDRKQAEERTRQENLALREEIDSFFDVRGNRWLLSSTL